MRGQGLDGIQWADDSLYTRLPLQVQIMTSPDTEPTKCPKCGEHDVLEAMEDPCGCDCHRAPPPGPDVIHASALRAGVPEDVADMMRDWAEKRAKPPTEVSSGMGEPPGRCADCGTALNEGEAKTFTVCDSCWDKAYPKPTTTVTSEAREQCPHCLLILGHTPECPDAGEMVRVTRDRLLQMTAGEYDAAITTAEQRGRDEAEAEWTQMRRRVLAQTRNISEAHQHIVDIVTRTKDTQ